MRAADAAPARRFAGGPLYAMNDGVLVSVVIPVFNGEATVARAIESALGQRFDGAFEVIVVNDGSTDATADVLRAFGDRIRVIEQDNRGVSAARNAAIRAARGGLIALLDADDYWFPLMLAHAVPVFERDPACVLEFGDGVLIDGAGRTVDALFVPADQRHAPALDEMLRTVWHIRTNTVVIRRSALEQIGGFPEDFPPHSQGGEDSIAFLRARELGHFVFVPERLGAVQLSTLEEVVAKRLGTLAAAQTRADLATRMRECVAGNAVFARLIRERYGARGEQLVREAIAAQAGMLVSLGLGAMHSGDRRLARRCYLMALDYARFDLRIYARLAWTLVPGAIANPILSRIPSRARRALAGPPYHQLESHAS
jgi:glycosyltransferase involved in cell wall biosynthesis